MVKAFGGICCVCGEEFPQEIFEFHHLNPKYKEFGLGKINSSCYSWRKIVSELRKCVLVCANCHRLVEYKYAKVPPDAPRFNECFADYKDYERNQKYDLCICGKKKLKMNKYCSRKCYNSHNRKVDWPNKNELKRLLESGWSLSKIGKMYGVTHNAVKKWKKFYKL